jgi:hypothetical protein
MGPFLLGLTALLLAIGFGHVSPQARKALKECEAEYDAAETLINNNAIRSAELHLAHANELGVEARRWLRLGIALYIVVIICSVWTLIAFT